MQKRIKKSYERYGIYYESLEDDLEHTGKSISSYLDADSNVDINSLASGEVPDMVPMETPEGMVAETASGDTTGFSERWALADFRRRGALILGVFLQHWHLKRRFVDIPFQGWRRFRVLYFIYHYNYGSTQYYLFG